MHHIVAVARIAGRTREQTRRAALSAALDIFAENGFSGASLAHIAQHAGVTAATLCHHFGDKRGLYDAVTDALYASIAQLERGLQADDSLAEMVEAVFLFAQGHRDAVRFMLRHALEQGRVDARVRERYMGPNLNRITPLLATRFGVSERRARNAIVALNHLIVRFVTSSTRDNALSLGIDDEAQLQGHIVALLVETAEALLHLPRSTPPTAPATMS